MVGAGEPQEVDGSGGEEDRAEGRGFEDHEVFEGARDAGDQEGRKEGRQEGSALGKAAGAPIPRRPRVLDRGRHILGGSGYAHAGGTA